MRRILVTLISLIALLLCTSCSNEELPSSTLKDCPQTDAPILAQGECSTTASWIIYEDGLMCIYGSEKIGYTPNREDVKWREYKDSIKNLYIGDGIVQICQFAFYDCKNLETVRFPDSMEGISISAFESCPKLRDVVIPDEVTKIDIWAFANCDSLTSIKIPGSLRTVSEYLFSGCDNLKEVTMATGVNKIAINAFEDNTSLETVTIPHSMRNIEAYAFKNCTNLKDVYYEHTNHNFDRLKVKELGNEFLLNAESHFLNQ